MMTVGTPMARGHDVDALGRAHQRGWVVGVLALVVVLLFGATIGASSTHSGAAHQLLGPNHHGSWSSDDGGGQHPLLLHTEGEQVETPDSAAHAVAEFVSFTMPATQPALLLDRIGGVPWTPAVVRAALQVWRT